MQLFTPLSLQLIHGTHTLYPCNYSILYRCQYSMGPTHCIHATNKCYIVANTPWDPHTASMQLINAISLPILHALSLPILPALDLLHGYLLHGHTVATIV